MKIDISSIVESGAHLKTIECFGFEELPDQISAVRMNFESVSLTFGIDEEFDEVTSLTERELEAMISCQLSPQLERVIGSRCVWCWKMTNNQGYTDGLRFEFSNGVIVEFVAVASIFNIFIATEV